MGGILRTRKKYQSPKNPYERERLVKELHIVGVYGLKNKKELWKHIQKAKKDKTKARDLLIETDEKIVRTQGESLLKELSRNGMLSTDFSDIKGDLRKVLNFEISDYLDRRLQSCVFRSGISKSISHARQMIISRKIKINGEIVNCPSFLVRSCDEGLIECSS